MEAVTVPKAAISFQLSSCGMLNRFRQGEGAN
jgi:hypothetical protein